MSDHPKGIRITAVDLETGEIAEKTIEPGNYVIIVAAPCRLAREQHYIDGTTVLTLEDRSPELLTTAMVDPAGRT